MLKFIFNSLNNTLTPSILVKINLFFFLNIQIFKNKFNSNILYFIENMSNLKFKKIKIFWNFSSFEIFNFYFNKNIFLIFLLMLVLI
jgi:hypothetical protein